MFLFTTLVSSSSNEILVRRVIINYVASNLSLHGISEFNYVLPGNGKYELELAPDQESVLFSGTQVPIRLFLGYWNEDPVGNLLYQGRRYSEGQWIEGAGKLSLTLETKTVKRVKIMFYFTIDGIRMPPMTGTFRIRDKS
jgi:hypothetical protein